MEQYFEAVTISQAHQDFLERLDALKEAEHAERAPGTNARRATPHRHQRAKPHRHQRAEPHPSARARARKHAKPSPREEGRDRPAQPPIGVATPEMGGGRGDAQTTSTHHRRRRRTRRRRVAKRRDRRARSSAKRRRATDAGGARDTQRVRMRLLAHHIPFHSTQRSRRSLNRSADCVLLFHSIPRTCCAGALDSSAARCLLLRASRPLRS